MLPGAQDGREHVVVASTFPGMSCCATSRSRLLPTGVLRFEALQQQQQVWPRLCTIASCKLHVHIRALSGGCVVCCFWGLFEDGRDCCAQRSGFSHSAVGQRIDRVFAASRTASMACDCGVLAQASMPQVGCSIWRCGIAVLRQSQHGPLRPCSFVPLQFSDCTPRGGCTCADRFWAPSGRKKVKTPQDRSMSSHVWLGLCADMQMHAASPRHKHGLHEAHRGALLCPHDALQPCPQLCWASGVPCPGLLMAVVCRRPGPATMLVCGPSGGCGRHLCG